MIKLKAERVNFGFLVHTASLHIAVRYNKFDQALESKARYYSNAHKRIAASPALEPFTLNTAHSISFRSVDMPKQFNCARF